MVGAGFVGSTTALRILQRGLADVCLIDVVEGLPQGLALDMNQSAPVERFEVAIRDWVPTASGMIPAADPEWPYAFSRNWLFSRAATGPTLLAMEHCCRVVELRQYGSRSPERPDSASIHASGPGRRAPTSRAASWSRRSTT